MPDEDRHEQFLAVHMSHQRQILAYLVAALRNLHDAEDLAQDVALAAWRGFRDYDDSWPYLPWALGIARNLVARHFRDHSRDPMSLPLDILEDVAVAMDLDEDALSREREALRKCLNRLPEAERDLIMRRYEPDSSLESLSGAFGRSVGAVNMLLCRIRRKLLKCASATIARESIA